VRIPLEGALVEEERARFKIPDESIRVVGAEDDIANTTIS